jgi:two-component system CheB/CheR fusion protein
MGKKNISAELSSPGRPQAASAGGVAGTGRSKLVDSDSCSLRGAGRNNTDVQVAGVGASAGGLEALQQLFKPLPMDCGLSFVVIQHLSPTYKSAMDQLLSRATALPVIQIENNLKVEPGHIYLSPPDKLVSMTRGKFRLTALKPSGRRRFLPIDHFFNVLATQKKEAAVCIILSGSASDGTQGLKAVKAAGGLTFVQSPDDAGYAGMPESAIATQMVDFILPAAKISEKLIAVLKHPYSRQIDVAPDQGNDLDVNLKQVFSIVRSKTGHDFSSYKTTTLSRRIARRMAIHQLSVFSDYVKLMAKDPAEPGRLVKDMLIGVTRFFRDGNAFETLQENVLVPWVQSRQPGERIRVWAAGCSSGEEAYSIAILLAEVMERLSIPLTVQIFASDIDADGIHTARLGVYPENTVDGVSPQRLSRFFNHRDSTYHIKKSIRDNLVFSVHNLINDPPFSKSTWSAAATC